MLQKFIDVLKEKSWKAWLFHVALMMTVIIALIFTFFYIYLPSTTKHGETVTVPNLEGMPLDQMDEFLKKRHLNYEVSDSNYTSDYPPLTILLHYPHAGSYVKENRKIYLTVNSRQPKSVNMPNLIDGSLKNAELVLKSYGLRRGEIKYVPDLASNAVLEQLFEGKNIVHGTSILRGSKIDLVVGDGLGRRVFGVPRFIGLPVDEADFSIKGSGLNTGSVIIRIIDEEKKIELVQLAKELEIDTASIIESGYVFQQKPEIGNDIRLGQQVDLWVVSQDHEDSLNVLEHWKNRGEENLSTGDSDEK